MDYNLNEQEETFTLEEINDADDPVEEIETLENIESASAGCNASIDSFDASEKIDRALLRSFSNTPFDASFLPVLFINKNLKVIYINGSCKQMFPKLNITPGSYFFDLFGKSFKMDEIRKIREAILSGGNGFSWKGNAFIKTRNTVSIQIRVYIFPLEMNLKMPSDFVVMFDDFTEENKKILRSVFISLLEASKLKDNDTGRHIVRVNEYSKRFAEELFKVGKEAYSRIDADFIDNIGFLASMHDVGKIGTPDDILNKEGPLSNWEWAVMREHTKNGAFILSTYPNPMAKEIALSHHEKWNGSGYPFQLEGNMIPLASRIVTIADVYDALRTERNYKPAFDHEIAKEKIIEQSGSQFDPNLIEIFKVIDKDFEDIYASFLD